MTKHRLALLAAMVSLSLVAAEPLQAQNSSLFSGARAANRARQQANQLQQPGLQQPGLQLQRPGMQQQGMQRPGMQRPGMQQPGLQQPGLQQPGLQQPGLQQPGLTLRDTSWTYVTVPPPREIQKHDIVSVRVDVLARMSADGELRRRKDAAYNTRLKDWIILDGLRSMRPDPQTDGEPRMRGELASDYRALGELDTSESLVFELACEVVDIRPNGNLVLEGRRKVVVGDECWTNVLTGICRPEAIGPNNVVLSRDIIHLDIKKVETGSVASGYQRGWFQKIFDLIQPF